jgi:cobalt/nickel transport system permease protein
VLFQFGGLTTLGVNTWNMALPAVAAYYLTRPLIYKGRPTALPAAGFLAGAAGILGAAALIALSLITTGEEFSYLASTFFIVNFPAVLVEGVLTAFILVFLMKVKPGTITGGN